jgi:hypothetical protein
MWERPRLTKKYAPQTYGPDPKLGPFLILVWHLALLVYMAFDFDVAATYRSWNALHVLRIPAFRRPILQPIRCRQDEWRQTTRRARSPLELCSARPCVSSNTPQYTDTIIYS